MEDIRVIFESMPPTIKGMVVKTFDTDGDYYTIVLNSNISYEEQMRTYKHETEHIRCRDFFREGASADEIERERH